ncbi:AmmeMemoRadiSam system protein B [Anaeromyxobacter diazotrophicus]|uniref:MEMO1 family protein AMYX_26130 n=1 Tax=Anaeromyxobacter diazotrophicus TaxID=2590199 RepID=A0A7I9VN92_9BACT|nr:AmmeMemoRadiSam system protein B [Anaeromyxobacter diazotrophicus]GEJ57872.1 MEMO1 family protein [Anaeromyxobacter diazotrophicus]
MDREPAVAGRFYPGGRAELAREVAALLGDASEAAPAVAVLAPHAGYLYSGGVAGATYARTAVPERAVVLCPNHTGLGEPVALWPDGGWRTPLGRVPLDPELTAALRGCPGVRPDRAAHLAEHALEVQLPFLQARRPEVAIAALCLGPLTVEACLALGEALAGALRARPALLVASSDMSHYVSAEEARRKDALALDRFLALDARGLFEVVEREEISMCGYVPATVALAAARALGAARAELVRYADSGDVTGDRAHVVGYAGAVVR